MGSIIDIIIIAGAVVFVVAVVTRSIKRKKQQPENVFCSGCRSCSAAGNNIETDNFCINIKEKTQTKPEQ